MAGGGIGTDLGRTGDGQQDRRPPQLPAFGQQARRGRHVRIVGQARKLRRRILLQVAIFGNRVEAHVAKRRRRASLVLHLEAQLDDVVVIPVGLRLLVLDGPALDMLVRDGWAPEQRLQPRAQIHLAVGQ